MVAPPRPRPGDHLDIMRVDRCCQDIQIDSVSMLYKPLNNRKLSAFRSGRHSWLIGRVVVLV